MALEASQIWDDTKAEVGGATMEKDRTPRGKGEVLVVLSGIFWPYGHSTTVKLDPTQSKIFATLVADAAIVAQRETGAA
jgi:hypothetical protein